MKYEIKPQQKKTFSPYTITFTIETPEEAALFHDHVACKIANSGQFIGDVYMASMGPLKANGIVNLKGFKNAEDS